MAIRLLVSHRTAENAQEAKEVLVDQDVADIGREKRCQLVLEEPAVSRTHARLTRDGPLLFVEDLGSSHGTRVNGIKLPKGEKRVLRNGDVIAIAQYDIKFDRLVDAAEAEPEVLDPRKALKSAMRGLGSKGAAPYLRVINGPLEGKRFELKDAQQLTIGRDAAADIILQSDLVSRQHARVRRDWSGTHVEDLQSRNGIRVNRRRVTHHTFKDRDELEVGSTRFVYVDPAAAEEVPPPEEEADPTHSATQGPALDEKPEPAPPPPAPEPPPEPPPAEPPPPAAESPPPEEEGPPPAEEPPPEEPPAQPAPSKVQLVATIGMVVVAILAALLVLLVFLGA